MRVSAEAFLSAQLPCFWTSSKRFTSAGGVGEGGLKALAAFEAWEPLNFL